MSDKIILILIYGCIYAAFGWWTTNTSPGRSLKHFLQTWKADGWVHGVMCSVTVFILGVCAILALGLTFKALGV